MNQYYRRVDEGARQRSLGDAAVEGEACHTAQYNGLSAEQEGYGMGGMNYPDMDYAEGYFPERPVCLGAIEQHGVELASGAIVTAEPGRLRLRPVSEQSEVQGDLAKPGESR